MNDPLTIALEALAEAEVELEEMNECGDLEDRMDAAIAVEEAKAHLERVRAKDAGR